MTQRFILKSSIALAAFAWVCGAQAANLSKDDYKATKTQISSTYKTEKSACDALSGNAKDICVETAKGHEKVALAELEFKFSGKAKDQDKLRIARAEANYEVAKERCDDKAGNDKDVCVKEAKAALAKDKADTRLNEEVREAQSDAIKDKRDADYKVAVEKCDTLAGDAKSACVAQAKAHFGQ